MAIDAGRVTGATETVSRAGTPDERRTWTRKLGGGGFMSWGMGNRVWVEASVPKAATGRNVEALPLDQALGVMRELVAEAQTFVPPNEERDGHRFETAKVVRIDLVRDFDGVENLGAVLDGLAEQVRPQRWKASRFSDSTRSGSATLSVGPRAWKATLYDKHAETGGDAPEGRLRFEVRLHHDQLVSVWARKHVGRPALSVLDGLAVRDSAPKSTRRPLFAVQDLDEESLLDLRKSVFGRVGYGKEIMSTDALRQKVFRPVVDPCSMRDEHGLTKREQRELWAFLTAGADLCGFSRNVRSKYRRLADELGVTLEHVTDPGVVTARLDFEQGRQVFKAAA